MVRHHERAFDTLLQFDDPALQLDDRVGPFLARFRRPVAQPDVDDQVHVRVPFAGVEIDPFLAAKADGSRLVLVFDDLRQRLFEQVLDAALGEQAGDQLDAPLRPRHDPGNPGGRLVERIGVKPLAVSRHAGSRFALRLDVFNQRQRHRPNGLRHQGHHRVADRGATFRENRPADDVGQHIVHVDAFVDDRPRVVQLVHVVENLAPDYRID